MGESSKGIGTPTISRQRNPKIYKCGHTEALLKQWPTHKTFFFFFEISFITIDSSSYVEEPILCYYYFARFFSNFTTTEMVRNFCLNKNV